MPDWLVVLLIVLGSLLLLLLAFFISNGIVYTNISFRRRKGDANFAENEDPKAKQAPDRLWFFSQSLEEIILDSYDGLKLKGYFINNHSNKLAILVHGYHGRFYSVTSQARIFFENGFDVLTINNRVHDSSEGKLITMGKRESKDVMDWIELMLRRNPNYQIALYGISMGGHIVMKTASKKNVNEKVKCVIEDCGYHSMKDELVLMTKKSPSPIPRTTVTFADLYSRLVHHVSFTYTIKKAFKNLKMPILIIHGDKDDYVPPYNAELNYDAVPDGVYKEKHIFKGAGHTQCVVNEKEKYARIVNEFVNKFIK